MIAQITPDQLAFWRALLAPFADHELSVVPSRGSKKELTYLDKRALSNRLDTVCGPHGWYPEYEATNRGYKCRLHILVPMANGSWVWMHKEDGAGFEEMGSLNKSTGEWEADVDNDEKSGYTNAMRRAAQDAWGIGRYLYRKGIPAWLDPNAQPLSAAELMPASAPTARQPRAEYDDRPAPQQPAPAPAAAPQQPATQQPAANGQRTFDNFKIPRPGKSVFAWACEMQKAFETKLIEGMQREAANRGYSTTFNEWDEGQVQDICTGVISYVMTLPTYKGQFDHLIGTLPAAAAQPPAPAASTGDLAALKRELVTKITALVEKQTGEKPTNDLIARAFQNIAPEVPNGQGHTGEVAEGLKSLTDAVWVRNMVAFVDQQIAEAARLPEADDSPSDLAGEGGGTS